MIDIKIHFTSLSSLSPVPSVVVTDNSSCPILNEGVVHAFSSLSLDHVLHVLKFSISLLSISQISKSHNCSVIFFPTYCAFQDLQTRMRIGLGFKRGGLYYLDNDASFCGLAMIPSPSSVSPLLWHYRLGHPSL